MSIARLSLVSVMGDIKYLDDAIIRCLDRGDFHPEPSMQVTGSIRGFSPISEENPYSEFLGKIVDLGVSAGLNPKYMPEHVDDEKLARMTHHKNQYIEDFYSEFRSAFDALGEKRNYLRRELEEDEGALVYLKHLEELDVDFDELFSCKYLKVRFGRIPSESYEKLSFYRGKPFIYTPFDVDAGYRWGAYFTLADDAPEIDDLFSSLYFERARVPEFVHGTPDEAYSHLTGEITANRESLKQTEKELAELVESKREIYYKIYTRIKFLSDSFDMRKYVSVMKRRFVDVFYITGFIEEEHAVDFAASLEQVKGVMVDVKPYDSDKRLTPPTKLKNGWFAAPFEMFVEMYGLPSYGDPDPTTYVAITYSLLFGIMFGDLGQGLLLVLVGWLLWKLKGLNLGRIINRIGISSCIFGTLYGSIFGFEDILTPFFVKVLRMKGKPIEIMAPENTNLILIATVALGVLLICISIITDIYIGFRRRDYERAVFSANGIAGLLFYVSVVFAAEMFFVMDVNLFHLGYVLPLMILPLAAILFKEPLGKLVRGSGLAGAKPHDGMSAYLTEGAFELFEVVLSFFSNTMSFLRVGGFVLSHAGMMMVVLTLAEMVGGAASSIVMVVGNLFVMCVEGLIVGIQVLRLEFYEMFSRYFDGGGKPFTPVTVRTTED